MEGAMDEQYEPLVDDSLLLEIITLAQNLRSSPNSSPVQAVRVDSILETTSSETVAPEPVKKKGRRRRDRNRPHHEIARLQAQVDELKRELEQQRTKASKRARTVLTAYAKNSELKKSLETTTECIQALEKTLRQQMSELVQVFPRCRVATTRVLPFDVAQDTSIFRMLAENVDEQYTNTNQVLHLTGLNGTASEVNDAHIWRPHNIGLMLKSRTRTLVPFESGAMEQALWKALRTDEAALLGPARTVNDLGLPLGRASRLAVLKIEVALGDFTCTMRMVIKQFIEHDRLVHVWDSVAHWPQVKAERNVTTHEHGWGFLQPVKDGVASVCECVLMTPTIRGSPPTEGCESVEYLTKLYQQFIVSRLQALENQTLDQTIQDRKSLATSNNI